ncbi:hypothetical protein [Saccharomonospora sp. NB11]|uniref:hypothetical protein n=1 Tax=Saccharomonospora sp. NB11 TaxID=1642298 RepID=UPI0018D1E356|nr:hypothetical protein [Saccharomonospora sp. NB11]
MDLFTAHTLLVEHPGGFRRALWRTTYDVSVYDEHDRLLATVVERSGPGAAALVRATGWSGHTSFDLRVVSSDGHDLLGIRKGFSLGNAKVAVTGGTGTALGSLTRHGRSDVALTDAVGTPLGTLGGVGSLRTGALAKRDGHRVRRDVLTLRPDLGSPTRALAIAAALAWDIVHGRGTTRPSGSAWPAG